ncbi:hypothetical protein ACFQY5_27185 [Paeniroseomonas aquatica]|uniref:hypothetical protein n=1 Tax=Paeniroseomonas aquatica TaxID=373043 RepID=UPI0036211364
MAAKPKVIGLANAGSDTVNCIKQAADRPQPPRHQARLAADVPARRPCPGACHRPGADLHRDLLLGPQRPHPRLQRPRPPEHRQQRALHEPRGRVCRGAALPEGRGRDGRRRRQGQWRRDRRPHEGDTLRRRLLRPRQHPRRWPQAAPGLPLRGEEARGEPRRLRLLQAAADHRERAGLPAAGRGRLRLRPQLGRPLPIPLAPGPLPR